MTSGARPASDAPAPPPGATRGGYLDRLAARSTAVGSVLCLGLDPDPATLPEGFSPDASGLERFARLVLEAALPHVAAVKPNLAFYEALGPDGLAALERIRASIPSDVPVIMDAKRGDIGPTAARQAVAIAGLMAADAVTLSPYLGRDAIDPFLESGDIFVYALCRTSNPAAGEVQGLTVEADEAHHWPREPLYARIARTAAGWAGPERLGFVVGATAPAELAEIRGLVTDRAFLVPGVGTQGGDLDAALRYGRARSGHHGHPRAGGGLLLNVSRAISAAAMQPSDGAPEHGLEERIQQAAAEWAAKMPVLS